MSLEETQLSAAFLLRAPHAIPSARFFRRNIMVGNIEGRKIRAGIKGQADLYGIVQGGLHIELELKTAYGVLSPHQRVWLSWCTAYDIPHLVLRQHSGEAHETTVARWLDEVRLLISQRQPRI